MVDRRPADYARIALAGLRLLYGAAALVVPGFLARRIGVDPDTQPGVNYVFRMFGVRTVLIGADLLASAGERRSAALRNAVVIHASDTVAAWLATRSGLFPKQGRVIVAISALNTLLAFAANR